MEERTDGTRYGNATADHVLAFRRRRMSDGYHSVGDTDNVGLGHGDGDRHGHHQTQDNGAPPTFQCAPSSSLTWNRTNAALFTGLSLLSAATTVPITLVPTMALNLAGTAADEVWDYAPYYNLETLEVYDGTTKRWLPFRIRTSGRGAARARAASSSSVFASCLTYFATLATAFGKFVNGMLVDMAGARRVFMLYGVCTCASLAGLSYSTSPAAAIACCAAVEFSASAFWSAGIVILGAHYPPAPPCRPTRRTAHQVENNHKESNGRFERGLYVTSLACRCGSLIAIPLSSLLIKWTTLTWRGVAVLAAGAALGGVAVAGLYLTDSPGKLHDPQNPIRIAPRESLGGDPSHHPSLAPTQQQSTVRRVAQVCCAISHTVLPSLRAILVSRVFWAVAAAHAGATMVKSSDRVLGTYFRDTSGGDVAEGKAGAMTVFLSLGMLGGLLVGGKAFARAADSEQRRGRTGPPRREAEPPGLRGQGSSLPLIDAAQLSTKNMIAFFYCLSIAMCYLLSFLAMPFVRWALHLPSLVLALQALASLGLGFGVAVQYYHIPAIVGATFGRQRGLYTSWLDGVAALVSSAVWRVVGGAVEEGNPQGGGWAYGWAAVALLLVICGTLMVKIVELYFVGGGWRHQQEEEHADENRRNTFPMELPKADGMNGSWMEESLEASSPLRTPGSLNILSTSALEYIGTPRRTARKGLGHSNSRDETADAVATGPNVDLLGGIHDDGSLLFLPSTENAAPLPQDIWTRDEDLVSFNSVLEPPTKKENQDGDGSCIRESSVFDDSSFEL